MIRCIVQTQGKASHRLKSIINTSIQSKTCGGNGSVSTGSTGNARKIYSRCFSVNWTNQMVESNGQNLQCKLNESNGQSH